MPARQELLAEGAAGIDPDVLASLLFGPHGAIGLDDRHDDLHLNAQRGLLGALFPPVTGDLLLFCY